MLETAKRFNVVDCGRRWGKTEMGMELTTDPLRAGYPVGWFSPNYKILLEAWADLYRKLKPWIVRSNKTERRIELSTGGKLEFWSLEDPDAGRSRAYKRVVIDEAALASALQSTWENAIRPTLTDYQGDAYFLSTPKGRNYFYQLWLRGQDPLEPEFMSWQMPTSSNPYLNKGEIEAARLELPESVFMQEYLAEFIEDSGLVFRNIRNCLRTPPDGPEAEHTYVAGVDWAQSQDWTVIVVMDRETKQVVDIDRFNQISWAIQRGRLAAMCHRWRVASVLAEENSIGGPNVEQLQAEGLPVEAFTTTNQSKADLVQALVLGFERVEIGIVLDAVLIGELEAFEVERLPSGRYRYSAPAGMHDDMVMALALAYWQALQGYDDAGAINYAEPYRVSRSSY